MVLAYECFQDVNGEVAVPRSVICFHAVLLSVDTPVPHVLFLVGVSLYILICIFVLLPVFFAFRKFDIVLLVVLYLTVVGIHAGVLGDDVGRVGQDQVYGVVADGRQVVHAVRVSDFHVS